eukprot:scaffold359549_cov47-Attheya_sp.AAC.1
MSEEKKFENAVALEAWLKSRGIDKDDVAEAAKILFGKKFNKPSRLLDISVDALTRAGITDPVAQELSNKLKEPPPQQQDGLSTPGPTQKRQKPTSQKPTRTANQNAGAAQNGIVA